jgi:hypothetical protein
LVIFLSLRNKRLNLPLQFVMVYGAFLGGFFPTVTYAAVGAIWAQEGGDKVAQHELRATNDAASVINRTWDGGWIRTFGARNEVVNFNVVLEAPAGASNVRVVLNNLTGPGNSRIESTPASSNQLFNYVNRNIEIFYVRYLQIRGLSRISYETYDERHIPLKFRRPFTGSGMGSGTWTNRPHHDAFYPEIAVPHELVPTFNIASGQNQSIWVDIYIPRTATPGSYTGSLLVQEGGVTTRQIPVQVVVRNFTLPDMPTAKTMLYISASNINRRYLGTSSVQAGTTAGVQAQVIRDRHFLVAHRHKLSLIGDTPDNCNSIADSPCSEWINRLNGNLFTAIQGYDGPGVGVGNNVYSIGTYGSWLWRALGQIAMNLHANAWVNWFTENAPNTEYFLYLADESPDTRQIEIWARWMQNNPGPGQRLKSFATLNLPIAAQECPALDIPASTLTVGAQNVWGPLANVYAGDARKRFYMYNGHRPATGSFATEDDGVALRQLAWAQFKKKIDRWFFWEATYYNNFQGNTGEVNLFRTAQTFGSSSQFDPVLGQTGGLYANGDGVLFYPGTDRVFPADSYGIEGPIASLRLKMWRRGIQDADYLAMASVVNPGAVQNIMNTIAPRVLWEYDVADLNDPNWVRTDVSWPTNPDAWENARNQLAALIETGVAGGTTFSLPGKPVFINPQPSYSLDAGLQATATNAARIRFSFTPLTALPTAGAVGTAAAPVGGRILAASSPSGAIAFNSISGIGPGLYRVSAVAENPMGTSAAAEVDIFLIPGDEARPRVYPNPWRVDRHQGLPITFDQMNLNSTVKIFTVSGHWVKTLSAPAGSTTWDLTTQNGDNAASGIYIYLATHDGRKATGKFVVIH